MSLLWVYSGSNERTVRPPQNKGAIESEQFFFRCAIAGPAKHLLWAAVPVARLDAEVGIRWECFGTCFYSYSFRCCLWFFTGSLWGFQFLCFVWSVISQCFAICSGCRVTVGFCFSVSCFHSLLSFLTTLYHFLSFPFCQGVGRGGRVHDGAVRVLLHPAIDSAGHLAHLPGAPETSVRTCFLFFKVLRLSWIELNWIESIWLIWFGLCLLKASC